MQFKEMSAKIFISPQKILRIFRHTYTCTERENKWRERKKGQGRKNVKFRQRFLYLSVSLLSADKKNFHVIAAVLSPISPELKCAKADKTQSPWDPCPETQ